MEDSVSLPIPSSSVELTDYPNAVKWGKALFKGTDDKLKGAVDGLNTDIQRMESATLFATLGQTIDIQRTTVQIGAIVSEMRGDTKQILAVSEETMTLARHTTQLGQENLETTQQNLEATQQVRISALPAWPRALSISFVC